MFWRKRCALCGSRIRKTFRLVVDPGPQGMADFVGRVGQLQKRNLPPNEIGHRCTRCHTICCFSCIMSHPAGNACPVCGTGRPKENA